MGAQKNPLNETVYLSTQNTCLNWWVRKNNNFMLKNFLIWTYEVYGMVADDYGILWIIFSEQFQFTRKTGMVNWWKSSHYIYLTNFFIKNNIQNYCLFYVWSLHYSNILSILNNRFLWNLYIINIITWADYGWNSSNFHHLEREIFLDYYPYPL